MTHATFFSYFKSEIEKLLDQKLTEKAEITVLLKKLAITSVRDFNQFIDQTMDGKFLYSVLGSGKILGKSMHLF